jgi:hypothetical protein
MKKLLLFIICLFTFTSQAQTRIPIVGDVFTTKSQSVPITYVRSYNTTDITHATLLAPYIRYEVTAVSTTEVEFNVLPLVEDAPSAKLLNYKIYKMTRADYDRTKSANGKEILRFGALALPVKVRSSEGEVNFEMDLNANFALAVRLIESFINDWDLSWQIGFGFGSTDLKSSNSNIEEGKDQRVQVLTGLTGLNLNFQGVQVGLYGGVDYINNQSQYDWKYNGNLFVSAGIGFNIFGGEPKDEKKTE